MPLAGFEKETLRSGQRRAHGVPSRPRVWAKCAVCFQSPPFPFLRPTEAQGNQISIEPFNIVEQCWSQNLLVEKAHALNSRAGGPGFLCFTACLGPGHTFWHAHCPAAPSGPSPSRDLTILPPIHFGPQLQKNILSLSSSKLRHIKICPSSRIIVNHLRPETFHRPVFYT